MKDAKKPSALNRNNPHLLPVRMFLTFIAVALYEYTHKCLAFFMCHRARDFVSVGNSMKSADTSLKRRERKKKATRDAIFRVAQKLFNQKGFENTSVEDITEKVDIAQSTFFNYFPRKEDILVEIFKRKLPFLRKKCQEIVALDEPITRKINKIFSTTARIAAQNEHITRAMIIKNFSSFSNKEYSGVFFEDFRSSLSLILKKGQEEGHIRRDVSALKLANMLEGVFTLFIIDCLVKRSYSMSSKELFHRLNLCLEGMIQTGKTKG